jgi:hypothetical protein
VFRFLVLDLSAVEHINPALVNVSNQGTESQDMKKGHYMMQAISRYAAPRSGVKIV